ncbi:MAG: O-unit flippase [Bacteroidia bacterium]|nr:MAG: O-unit flippase [Bacteroidia bacterium]
MPKPFARLLASFSPTLRKALSNLTWLSVDRVLRIGGAIIVNAWLTRYLGTELNGVMYYALSFAGMFAPLATLGLDALVVRDIVRNKAGRDELLGTAFVLRLTGASLAVLIAVGAVMAVRPGDGSTHWLVFLAGLGLTFQSFDVIDFWFQSQLQSKFTVYAKNAAFILLNLAKIGAILAGADVEVFILLTSLEFAAGGIGLVMMYRHNGFSVTRWTFRPDIFRHLLSNAWPLVLTDFGVLLQARIDQVMLGEMLGNESVGLYAAAVKLTEPFGFIPMIIMTSVYPVIVRSKEWSEDVFYNRMKNLYRIMTIVTLGIGLPVSLFSDEIVHFLYGQAFSPSAALVSLMIWSRVYANFGTARSIFISAENLFRHTLVCALSGSVVNIVVNYLLIPRLGVVGSIIGTYASFTVTVFVLDAIVPRTRRNFRAMITGLLTFYRLSRKWDEND